MRADQIPGGAKYERRVRGPEMNLYTPGGVRLFHFALSLTPEGEAFMIEKDRIGTGLGEPLQRMLHIFMTRCDGKHVESASCVWGRAGKNMGALFERKRELYVEQRRQNLQCAFETGKRRRNATEY